jgi:hypothetical protein
VCRFAKLFGKSQNSVVQTAVWSSISIHFNSFQFKLISIHFNLFIESTQLISNMYLYKNWNKLKLKWIEMNWYGSSHRLSKQLSPCLLLTWQWRRSPDHWASTDWCSRCCCRWEERCRHWPERSRSRCCCWCYCSGYWLRNCRSGAAKWREGNWYSRSDCPCHSWCSGGSFSRMPYLKWK